MSIFPINPSEFSTEFVNRMRNHPDIIQMPSFRQLQSIPQLLYARFLRKGDALSLRDYIEIASATSFPENQDLAKKIAFKIIFPDCTARELESFLNDSNDSTELYQEFQRCTEEESISLLLEEILNEIKFSKSFDFKKVDNVERFVEWIYKNQNQNPIKSALVFIDHTSEFYKNQITSLPELIELSKEKIIKKINSLTPQELRAVYELNFSEVIDQFSKNVWEKTIIKMLSNNFKPERDLEIIERKVKIEDLSNFFKYLSEINFNLLDNDIIVLNEYLINRLNDIEELYNAAMELKEIPDIELNEILKSSLKSLSLSSILKYSKILDQSFGLNCRRLLYNILDKDFSKNCYLKLILDGDNILVELVCKYPYHSASWISFYQKALSEEIEKAKKAFRSHEEFKILTNNVLQYKNSCGNIFCANIISQSLLKLSSLTIESCIVPTELKDVVEFLKEQNLSFEKQKIKQVGKKIGMSEDEIAELIEPPFDVLKRLMNKPHSDLRKIKNLIKKIQTELGLDKILELMSRALGVGNKEALAALGHYNLGLSLKAARMIEGKRGMEKLISTLTAGKGEDLITQWFLHRDEIPKFLKEKIKELAKSILIDLGINYSRNYCGRLNTGLFQTNLVRPYESGDSYEDIDLESTLFNILEKGKKLEHMTYDDFFVSITSNEKRTVCIEMDISESMTGKKLAYMSICVTMLVYGMRKDELGITLFEKNTHVLKEIDQKIELEKLADELLSLKSRGTTFVKKALDWARYQFKKSLGSKGKLNILFTDSDIFDLPDAAEILRAFKSLQVDFILVCPEKHNIKESEKIIKLAGGQLLKVEDWEKFPELITNIINSRL